jgi:selenide,water dikinase
VEWQSGISLHDQQLIADPQTSGGLLLAVPPGKLDGLLANLQQKGALASAVVGQLRAAESGEARMRVSRSRG